MKSDTEKSQPVTGTDQEKLWEGFERKPLGELMRDRRAKQSDSGSAESGGDGEAGSQSHGVEPTHLFTTLGIRLNKPGMDGSQKAETEAEKKDDGPVPTLSKSTGPIDATVPIAPKRKMGR